jgi:outer membrane immunogenic protein
MMRLFFGACAAAALISAPALGADMALKAPPMPPEPTWTGWYIGINGGGAFNASDPFIGSETNGGIPFVSGTWPGFGNFGNLTSSGGFGGGQVGFNWQRGAFVYGAEVDFQGAGVRGTQSATLPYIVAPNTVTEGLSSNLDWFGSVRGRLGYAWNNVLLYATGGFAFGGVRNTFSYADTFGFTGFRNSSSTRGGYSAGAGIEYAFTPRLSAKFEYQFIDLGSSTIALTEFFAGAPTTFADSATAHFWYNTFRLGLNYHF